MNGLLLPDFEVGMIVVCPSSNIPGITEDKKYVITDLEKGWVMIRNDEEETRYYQCHLFIEADVYYNMLLWLTFMRLFELDPQDM